MRTYKVNRYIERYGSETFVKYFNEKIAEWFHSEEIVLNCNWDVLEYFIRPSTFKIKSGQIGTFTNDGWLIQRLKNRFVGSSTQKEIDRRTYDVNKYIGRYGCETFVKYFNERLEDWFQSDENEVNCDLHLFVKFVRPQSCQSLGLGKIIIYIEDEDIISFLFSKLKEQTDINTVKSYIKKYGSNEFITNFNERLKEKLTRQHVLDPECTWECLLERFFENVSSSEANCVDYCSQGSDIDTGLLLEIDSSISIDTNSSSGDSDSNIDVDSSNSSEDSESCSNIDVDSSNYSEDDDNETNSDNDVNNGVSVMME